MTRGCWMLCGMMGFGYSLAVFMIGLLGVMLGALWGTPGQSWGWWFGSLLAALGQPPAFALAFVLLRPERHGSKPKGRTVESLGLKRNARAGLILGAILGALIGFYLSLGWVWWAFSPWADEQLRARMHVGFFEISGSSPTPVLLFLVPIVLLATVGVVMGALVGIPRDWIGK